MVDSIHPATLARHHGNACHQFPHRQGGKAEVDEEEHHQVRPLVLLHGHQSRQLQGQEEVP